MAKDNESSADIALRYVASFATADPDVISKNVTEDFVNAQAGALGKGCETRETYRERLAGFLAAFEGLHYEVVSVIEQIDRVAVCYEMLAKSNGHSINIPGVMVITIRDGLVASRHDYWDGLTFLEQTEQR